MRIGLKLTAAFLAIASLVGVVGYMAVGTSREVEEQMERLSRSAVVKADTVEMLDSLYAAQLAAHALVAHDRRTAEADRVPVAELQELRGRIETYLQSVERSLERQWSAVELSSVASAGAEQNQQADERTISLRRSLEQVQQQFGKHRLLLNDFLGMVAATPDEAEQFLEGRLDKKFEDELLPPLTALGNRAATEFTRGIRSTQRAMAVADQRRSVMTMIAAAGAVLLGLAASRSIARNLGELEKAAKEMGQGRLKTRVAIRSRDEFGALATSLNRMAADLEERTVSISRHKEAESRLLVSLREKELLLKEVHHRVKNNLQVICSLLNLQARTLRDPEAIRLFQESQSRIRSMALIHEQLYRSEDLARIEFRSYVEQLVSHVKHTLGSSSRVEICPEVEPVPLPLDIALPCGMIIHELLSNAIEHAFPGGRSGTVRVAFGRAAGGYRLEVADDGVGMARAPAGANETSLGTKVVQALARQLHGNLDVFSDGGTTVTLRFGGCPGESPPVPRESTLECT